MALKQRSIVSVILLSLLTCGIYSIYWFVVVTNEIQASLRNPDGSVGSGGMCFLLGIVTCGIYTIYWYYKQGQRVSQLRQENGLQSNDNTVLYVILSIFGLAIVADAIIQGELNAVIDASYNNYNNGGNGYNNQNYNNGGHNDYNNHYNNGNSGGYNDYNNNGDNYN